MAFTNPRRRTFVVFVAIPPTARRNSGFANWRFSQAYGLLEFRMNNLSVMRKRPSCGAILAR